MDIIGFSGVSGFVTGYTLTKLGKVGVVVLGSGLLFVQGLSHVGYVTTHWDKAEHDFNQLCDQSEMLNQIVRNNMSSTVAFSSGLLIGIKMAK